jgi:hypothetical protein
MSLLSTETSIKCRLEAQSHEIRIIDEHTSILQIQLLGLGTHRTNLVKHYAVGQALLAPIRTLPVEILEEILVQSIQKFCMEMMKVKMTDDPLHLDGSNPHVARARLRQVYLI